LGELLLEALAEFCARASIATPVAWYAVACLPRSSRKASCWL